MRPLQKAVVLCAVFVLASCAATRPPLPEIKLPPEKISQEGYSLMPLNEPGWVIEQRNSYTFALGKLGGNHDETFAMQAMFSRLPAYDTNAKFLQMIKDGQSKDSGSPRFEILKLDVSPFPMKGTDCAESHMVTIDHAAKRRSGNSGDMILEALTLSCAHPSDKSVAIYVTYSHRHDPGQDDPAFMEKGAAVLNSVELFEPDQPYITQAEKANDKLAQNFSASCSQMISQPLPPKDGALHDKKIDALAKLSAMGISIGGESSGRQIGAYALFTKGADGAYSLSAIDPSYIEPSDIKNQEVLFVSPSLDKIAPAFAEQRFNDANQAFVCESGTKFVTGIDSSYRAHYNPCDSSLTSSSGKVGAAVLANSLLTVLSLGTNVVTGSSVYYVNTDKDKVAKLVVDSRLFQCLEEANRSGLKADIVASAAMVAKADDEKAYDAGKADLEKLGGSDCSGNNSGVSAETYYKRGKALISINRYKEAIACFERVQGEAADKGIYQDSCYQISLMYELGWGVDKDTEKAKFWLNKAGL